jgi:hypothetical protein
MADVHASQVAATVRRPRNPHLVTASDVRAINRWGEMP